MIYRFQIDKQSAWTEKLIDHRHACFLLQQYQKWDSQLLLECMQTVAFRNVPFARLARLNRGNFCGATNISLGRTLEIRFESSICVSIWTFVSHVSWPLTRPSLAYVIKLHTVVLHWVNVKAHTITGFYGAAECIRSVCVVSGTNIWVRLTAIRNLFVWLSEENKYQWLLVYTEYIFFYFHSFVN